MSKYEFLHKKLTKMLVDAEGYTELQWLYVRMSLELQQAFGLRREEPASDSGSPRSKTALRKVFENCIG